MTKVEWVLIGIAVLIVLLAFLFRGSLKARLEVLGIKASVEAANHPPPAAENDCSKERADQSTGDVIIASAPSAVAVNKAPGAMIVTGSGNKVSPSRRTDS